MMELIVQIVQPAFVFIFACDSTLRLSAAVPSAVGKILGSN